MNVEIGETISKSIMAPFRDKDIFTLALTYAIISLIITAILVLTGISSPSSASPFSTLLSNTATTQQPNISAAKITWSVLSSIVMLLISIAITTAIIIKAHYGEKYGISKALGLMKSRYFTVLAVDILIFLIVFIPLLLMFLLIGALSIASSSSFASLAIFFVIALILVVVYLFFVGIRFAIAVPFAVINNSGPINSLKSSWNSMKGNMWGVFAIALVIGIVMFVIELIFDVPILLTSNPMFAVIPSAISSFLSSCYAVAMALNT